VYSSEAIDAAALEIAHPGEVIAGYGCEILDG
jgi:hypothetical protein